MAETQEMKELMHRLVQLRNKRARKYHYKIAGDEPECLSCLLEVDDAGMDHLLHQRGLCF
jgi:hypothetical protein